ncbi:MAG TPA: hypothetical protein VK934_07830 [Fimbriimonas sp.]|nr:hypothetical protein [Fimbriimonas sp.]
MKHLLRLSISCAALAVFASAFAGGNTFAGTWMVHKDGKPNPNMKLVFSPKGEFKFVGIGYSSAGKYTISGNEIRLLWTRVDSTPVKLGTMKKTLHVTPEQTFTIDQYTYKMAPLSARR